MPATVIDGISRWRKAGVGKGAHGDTHGRLFVTFFGVEHGCPADRAEPELELGSLITNANILSCGAKDLIGCGEAGQRCKDTAGPTLAGEAVANADSEWFALNFNTQLSTGTRGCSRTHSAPLGMFAPALIIEGKQMHSVKTTKAWEAAIASGMAGLRHLRLLGRCPEPGQNGQLGRKRIFRLL
jgi:hypothetical protein